jgi:hypothetical protein
MLQHAEAYQTGQAQVDPAVLQQMAEILVPAYACLTKGCSALAWGVEIAMATPWGRAAKAPDVGHAAWVANKGGEALSVAGGTATIIGRSVGAREAMWSGKKITNELAKTLGVDRKELGRAVEKIKQGWGMRGDHNATIGRATGNVYDSRTGELLGNVLEEIGR